MNRITAYIIKTLAVTIALTLLLFVGIELIFAWMNELRVVGKGDYTVARAAMTIGLMLPGQIAHIFPMAVLVGGLAGLGLLSSRSELIVMQSAGLSMRDIATIVLKFAFILAMMIWIVGEWVAPALEQWAHRQKSVALSKGQALYTTHGMWMREGEKFIHIQAMPTRDHLEGITIYEFDENMDLQQSSVAKEAKYRDKRWILYDIRETRFSGEHTVVEHQSERLWTSRMDPEILNIVKVEDSDELSLIGLWQTIRYRRENHLDLKPYQLAFWQKIFRPFSTLVMMFLAIPFIFGPLRSATMGWRMLVGILVGFGFYTLSELFSPLTIVYNIPPFWGACLPIVLFWILGISMTRRMRFA